MTEKNDLRDRVVNLGTHFESDQVDAVVELLEEIRRETAEKIFPEGYYPAHLTAWADQLEREYGYQRANIVVFLRDLAKRWQSLKSYPKYYQRRRTKMLEEQIAEIIKAETKGGYLKDWHSVRDKLLQEQIDDYFHHIAEAIKSLFPPDIEELLKKLECPECDGKGEKRTGGDAVDYFRTCPTCKGTGLALHRRMVVVDMDAELPEMLESSYGKEPYSLNSYSYNAAQQDMIDEGWVKEVCNWMIGNGGR